MKGLVRLSKYLLTQSLLSSWLYALDTSFDSPDKYTEFLATLRKEETPRSEAMQDGLDFEALVTRIIGGDMSTGHKWQQGAEAVAKELWGAVLQVRLSREITVDGMDFLLYGVLDALEAGEITDTKFSKRYEVGKYLDSVQHPTYFYICPNARRFTYTISNGEYVWHERYYREDTRPIESIIREFIGYLRTAGLMDTYTQHWRAKE